jgi:hypothetical protein
MVSWSHWLGSSAITAMSSKSTCCYYTLPTIPPPPPPFVSQSSGVWLRSIVSTHTCSWVSPRIWLDWRVALFCCCCYLKIGTDDGRAKDLRMLSNWIWASGVNEKPPHYLQILWCLKSKCFTFWLSPRNTHTHTHLHFISKSKTSMDLLRFVLNQPGSCGL